MEAILMSARSWAEKCVANAKAAVDSKKKRCAKKTLLLCNGYIVERLYPSGKYRVKSEAAGRTVLVDSRKKAKRICINNCTIE